MIAPFGICPALGVVDGRRAALLLFGELLLKCRNFAAEAVFGLLVLFPLGFKLIHALIEGVDLLLRGGLTDCLGDIGFASFELFCSFPVLGKLGLFQFDALAQHNCFNCHN